MGGRQRKNGDIVTIKNSAYFCDFNYADANDDHTVLLWILASRPAVVVRQHVVVGNNDIHGLAAS